MFFEDRNRFCGGGRPGLSRPLTPSLLQLSETLRVNVRFVETPRFKRQPAEFQNNCKDGGGSYVFVSHEAVPRCDELRSSEVALHQRGTEGISWQRLVFCVEFCPSVLLSAVLLLKSDMKNELSFHNELSTSERCTWVDPRVRLGNIRSHSDAHGVTPYTAVLLAAGSSGLFCFDLGRFCFRGTSSRQRKK